MKNITFTAKNSLIERARKKAETENTTLNQRFREWLERYASQDDPSVEFDNLLNKFDYAKPGRKFSREELNER